MRTKSMIDDPNGYEYTPAPAEVQTMMRRRFDDNGITAIDPNHSYMLLHNIENSWDGAYSVCDNGNGTFTYLNPWTQESDTFSAIGYYNRKGEFVKWED